MKNQEVAPTLRYVIVFYNKNNIIIIIITIL